MAEVDTRTFIALLGGVLPALFWLWFWLREDRKNPEPKGLILETFVLGGTAAFVAYVLERYVQSLGLTMVLVTLLWAAIEEVVKLGAAYFGAFIHKEFDEPVDAMTYIVTAALGFAAVENTLFLLKALSGSTPGYTVFLTGNVRFIGATLLHVVASASLGASYAFAFFRSRMRKEFSIAIGLLCATLLHFAFNFFILSQGAVDPIFIFLGLWSAVVIIFLLFERVKRITN